jgi:hypothetical protein
VMVVINMDDLNVWIQACEKRATLFRCVVPMVIEIWQLPNIEIDCVMPLYVEVVIGFEFEGLNEEIMFTCSK